MLQCVAFWGCRFNLPLPEFAAEVQISIIMLQCVAAVCVVAECVAVCRVAVCLVAVCCSAFVVDVSISV